MSVIYAVDNEDFGKIEPEELRFTFLPKTKISCTVKCINKSNRFQMAFKVKATHPKLYCARPIVGLIKPCETCEIVITRQAQHVMPLPCEIAKQKFLIERLLVPEDTTFINDNISSVFYSEDWRKHISGKKLKVVVVDDYGEIVQPEELRFTFMRPKTDRVSCIVNLINKSAHYHMAFKVKTTHPKLYYVKPNRGIIKPCETCEIVITRLAQDEMPLPCEIAKEKLLIERLFVPEDTTTSIKLDDISNTIFKSEDWIKHINKKKLKVVLVDASPATEVNIREIGAKLDEVDDESIPLLEGQKMNCCEKKRKCSSSFFTRCFNM